MDKNYANYHIGLKILLKNKDKFLFIRDLETGKLDLPGGRIDDVESNVPLKKILEREIREELGNKIKYRLGEVLFNHRRFRDDKNFSIFMVVYEANYLGGEIKLSDEHTDFMWLDPKKYNFRKKDFVGEELETFKKYFKNL